MDQTKGGAGIAARKAIRSDGVRLMLARYDKNRNQINTAENMKKGIGSFPLRQLSKI